MNKPLTLLSAIAFGAMLSGTAIAAPADITIDVIDPSANSVADVTRHIEVRDEGQRSDTAKEHAMDADHEANDDKSESKDSMNDSKDDMNDSKDDMNDTKDDMNDTKNDAHDNG